MRHKTLTSLEAWTRLKAEEGVDTRGQFHGEKAMVVIFAQNAPFSGGLLELYKWLPYLASAGTHCP